MSKGDKPRNCFSREFKSNYDDIEWNTRSETVSKIEGMIRQSTDNPIASNEVTLPPDWEDCEEDSCANE